MLNQSLYIFSAKMVGYALRLVLPYFLVRELSVADFGSYRQFFLLEMYFDALFQLGLNQALYYFIPRDMKNAGAYFLNTVLMNLGVFAVAFTLMGTLSGRLSSWLNMSILETGFWLLVPYVSFQMLVAACDAYLNSRRSVRAAAFFEIFGQTVVSISCVATAFLSRDLHTVLLALVISRCVQLLGMVAFIHFKLHGLRATRYFIGLREQIRYGIVLGFAGTLMSQLSKLHDFVVSHYYGTESYAIYSAGCTELPVIQLFTQSVAVVVLGQFAMFEQQKDWEGARRLWRRVLTSSYAVAVPVTILLIVLAKPIILFMFTEKYAAAIPIFQLNSILKLGLIFNGTLVLRAMSRNDVTIKVNAVALALTVPMLYAGMKFGGMAGIILAQALLMIGSRLAVVVVMNRIIETPLPYHVGIGDVLDFYHESWAKGLSVARALRAGSKGAPAPGGSNVRYHGILGAGGVEPQAAAALGAAMAARIAHRGPDDDGVWCDAPAGLVLAHRRLSILDLSPAGHQPMSSCSGRFVMVFNGEIYNFQDLRGQVEGARSIAPIWRGHSDTEVLLEGFELWGVEATIGRSVGMFAMAIWDRQERELYLARDRMGEKPLYFGWQRGVFLFGSELKSLTGHPSFERDVDRDALALLLGHNYIPAPYSIWSGIAKLPPAHCLRLREGQTEPDIRAYWSLADVAVAGQAAPFAGSDSEAVDELEKLLGDAVALQMVADVPLGAFLSGGVDSSAIVAMMQARSSRPVRTFTIGFDQPGLNEAGHAKAVARHLGTDHTELYMSPSDLLGVVPRLPQYYDEPFADASQIPTRLVAGLARRHVTVSLSGDAGDELFGGYERYFLARGLWGRLAGIPGPARRALAVCLDAAAGSADETGLRKSRPVPGRWRGRPLDARFRQAAELLRCCEAEDVFRGIVSHWRSPAAIVRGAASRPTALSSGITMPAVGGFEHRMMYLDAMSYLSDDVLCKVDRAAMSVSLETRVPLLDHRVVEFAWRLPLRLKVRGDQGKWILRQVLYRHVPQALIDRPKVGFGVPLASWLRGELREWGADLLAPDRLAREGFFRPEPVLRRWNEHQACVQDWHFSLWSVLMFQAWLEEQRRSLE